MEDAEVKLLDLPALQCSLPLNGDDWVGGDGSQWRDVAVDSSSEFVQAWVRRRIKDDKYFLIVSVVEGHVLAYELTLEEAKDLYAIFPNRAPYVRAFDSLYEPEEKDDEGLDIVT